MANLLTALRLVLALPVAWMLADASHASPALLASLLGLAIGSDFLDGIVARRTSSASDRGQLFDHTTDFLFVTAGMLGAAYAGLVHLLLPVLVVIAFMQYVLDSYYWTRQKQLRMSLLGRCNGVLYFAPLVLVVLSRLEFLSPLATQLLTLNKVLVPVLIFSTVASIIDRAVAPLRKQGGTQR